MTPISKIQTFLFISFVFLLVAAVSFPHADAAELYPSGNKELVLSRRLTAEMPVGLLVDNSSFVLAAERTQRKDPTNGHMRYMGGWNISNKHYWASVGYSAYPVLAAAIAWFAIFGLALFFTCCFYCCFGRRDYSYSPTAYTLSFILLILLTCAVIIGCSILYTGQGRFHQSTSKTLDYVEGQADYTVENLRNFSHSLAAAKSIDVDNIFLPSDVQGRIDSIQKKLDTAANELSSQASSNVKKIDDALNTVQIFLVVIAAVMLLLVLLGLLFSVFGLQVLVYILAVIGWVILTGTLILCSVVVVFHNVVADTCVAMEEWVLHPHAHTALDDVLPCVDTSTAIESMNQSKEVTFQLVTIINRASSNISNVDFPPMVPPPLNYNQSGPSVPVLCNPYMLDMSDGNCSSGELTLENATEVWRNYVCNATTVDGHEICTTVGRLTPGLYTQFASAVRMSGGIYDYAPFLAQLADCTFARETFAGISSNNCPTLTRYSKWVYEGLALTSAAVMLSFVFFFIYARERQHRKHNKQFIAMSDQQPYQYTDKA